MNKEPSLASRFGLNSVAFGYAQLLTIGVQFLQVPLFLHFWGVQLYGEWIVLAGIPLTLSILDLGITQAAASQSAIQSGRHDWNAAKNTLATTRLYALAIGVVAVTAVSLGAALIDWSHLLKLELVDRGNASTVLIVLTLALAINFQGGFLDAWMRAYGAAAISGFVGSSIRLCEIVTSAALLWSGVGVVGIAVGYLACALFIRVVHAVVASRWAPTVLDSLGSFDARTLRELIRPGSGFIAISLTQVLTIQGGIQMLNQIASPAQVVAFNMTRTLVRLIMNLGMVANNALRPEFSAMIGADNRVGAVLFLRKVWLWVTLLACVAYGMIVAFGPWFLGVWSGGQVYENQWYVALLGIHALCGVFWVVPGSLLMAENKHGDYAVIYALSAVGSLFVWVALSGVVAPVVGAALLLAIPEFTMAVLITRAVVSNRFSVMSCKDAVTRVAT